MVNFKLSESCKITNERTIQLKNVIIGVSPLLPCRSDNGLLRTL